MRFATWIATAIVVVALIAIAGAYVYGISAWVLIVFLLAGFAAQLVLESAEDYFPGGVKNPYTAKTVGKPNVGIKILVFGAAVIIATVVWAATIVFLRYVT